MNATPTIDFDHLKALVPSVRRARDNRGVAGARLPGGRLLSVNLVPGEWWVTDRGWPVIKGRGIGLSDLQAFLEISEGGGHV